MFHAIRFTTVHDAKTGEKLNLPVLFYPELLGLAMGFSTQELGMDMHRIDTAAFLSSGIQI